MSDHLHHLPRLTAEGFHAIRQSIDESLARRDDELARQARTLERLTERVDRISRIFEGNSNPPLAARLALIESRVGEHRRLAMAVLGAVGLQALAAAGAVAVWFVTN